jgi:hypothetical protein
MFRVRPFVRTGSEARWSLGHVNATKSLRHQWRAQQIGPPRVRIQESGTGRAEFLRDAPNVILKVFQGIRGWYVGSMRCRVQKQKTVLSHRQVLEAGSVPTQRTASDRVSNDLARGGAPRRRTCACHLPRNRRIVAMSQPVNLPNSLEDAGDPVPRT